MNDLAGHIITKLQELGILKIKIVMNILGINEQLDQNEVSELVDSNRKYRALLEYLIENLDSQNIINEDHLELIKIIEDQTGFDENKMNDYIKEKDLQRALGLEDDLEQECYFINNEIELIEQQINIKKEQLQYLTHIESQQQSQDNNMAHKEAIKIQRDINTLVDDTNEILDQTTQNTIQSSNELLLDFIAMADNPKSEQEQQQREKIILNYDNKILNSTLNNTQMVVQQFVNTINILTNNIIIELRNEVANKTDVEGMREVMMKNDKEYSEEIQNYIHEREKLIEEIDQVKESLTQVKKDNLCAQLNYERWKQTYESHEQIKKQKTSMKNLGDQSDRQSQHELIEELQQQTSDLLIQVLEQQEQDLNLQISIVKEEANAKSNLQLDNLREQTLLTNLKQSESRIKRVLLMVHLIQAIVEWDQYQTQEVFDKFQQIAKMAEESKFNIDLEAKEFDDIVKMEMDRESKRTTIDERDQLMTGIKDILNKIDKKEEDVLFTYKQDIVHRLTEIVLSTKQKQYSPSRQKKGHTNTITKQQKRFDKMLLRTLTEIFKNTYDKRKGELVSENVERLQKIEEIQYLISEFNQNIENFKALVIQDKKKNTAKGNGIEIKSEEVITDFLNNRSEKLKKIFK